MCAPPKDAWLIYEKAPTNPNNLWGSVFERYRGVSCKSQRGVNHVLLSGVCFHKILQKPRYANYFFLNMLKPMSQRRTTPEFITELQPGEIFVFGSNLRGMHGGGAAYAAYRKFGAIMGQGVGLQGQSYAIPTMQGGVETIRPYVDEFIEFAKAHPELTFLVTRIGCGIAGFTDEEISPLFEAAHNIDNIVLPEGW